MAQKSSDQGCLPGGCGPAWGNALWGWAPSDLPASTASRRAVDRLLPRRGWGVTMYFAAVVGLLGLAAVLTPRGALVADGVAALAAGTWCSLNFWRCRHAHCVVSGTGWLALSVLAFAGAGIGHSLIGGREQTAFLGVLGAGLLFECCWHRVRGTNALVR